METPRACTPIGQEAKEGLEAARAAVASCIGAQPREITFTSGGSEADNQAISPPRQLTARARAGSTSSPPTFEHHAVLHTLAKLEKEGFEVTLLDVDETGTRYRSAGEGRYPAGHLSGHRHVRQQRDRHHPAHRGDRCTSARKRACCSTPTPCRQWDISPIDVKAHEHRYAEPVRPQVPRPQGRGRAVCPAGRTHRPVIIEGGAQERGKRAGTENVPGIAGYGRCAGGCLRPHGREPGQGRRLCGTGSLRGCQQIPHSALNGDPVTRLARQRQLLLRGH